MNGSLRRGNCFRRILLAIIVPCICFSATNAHPNEQRQKYFTLKANDIPLHRVFKTIQKQTQLQVFYNNADLNDQERVSVAFNNSPIDEVFTFLLRGKNLNWEVHNNKIVITKEESGKKNAASTKVVTDTIISVIPAVVGKVADADDKPISNATVQVKGKQEGTITDKDGIFYLSNVGFNATLLITSLGYLPREVPVKGKIIQVKMKLSISDLDETIVMGYGTTTRRFNTGNIGVVRAEEIEKQPVMNPLLALQGRIAGLNVTQTSGYASAPIKVELRGRSSINDRFSSDPLYIIDGVPLTIMELGGVSSYYTGSTGFIQNDAGFTGPANGQSPLFNINPSDIASIEVLKDADATSIYGSRGANGVILITTKKGKAGKTKLDIHIEQGINKVTRFWKMLNTQEYLAMRGEAFKNDGITPDPGNAYDLLVWDTSRYTDWQRVLYGGMGKNLSAQASLSGGDSRTTFRIGTGYTRVTNITTVSGADKKASLSFNLNHKSANQHLGISLSGSYSLTQSDMINMPGSITMPPNAPPIFDEAGNLNYAGWGAPSSPSRNAFPFSGLKQPYSSKANFLNTNLSLSYQLLDGLTISSNLGYNIGRANQEQFNYITSQDPANNPAGNASWGINSTENWIVEPQITYNTRIGKGSVNILVGTSYQENKTQGIFIAGSGYTSDYLIKTISNAPSQYGSDTHGEYKYAAVFGRISYNWENKYIFNVSARRDGSSRFGRGRQFGNFGAMGVAWIFSEEKWLKNISFLSFGKLRGSYGTTGSDGVGDYQYLTRWSSSSLFPYNGIAPLTPTQHANPDFQWQVNKKLEGGLELGFFNNRFDVTAVYYRDRVGNQLVSFPVPIYTGFSNVTANSPALVQNDGWEFTLQAQAVKTRNFTWSINFNIGINRNKLIAYPNFELSPYVGRLVVGQPLNIVRILHYSGVDTKTGEYTFEDKNQDGQVTIDYSGKKEDDRYVYYISPKFIGGLGMNFNYKNLQLSMFFNIKKQVGVNAINQGNYPGLISNQPVGVLARWQNSGDAAATARFTTQYKDSDAYFRTFSDGGYTDASYIRLSNLSVSYSLPAAFIEKIGMKGCNLYLHSNNLFVITKYKGIDPETQNFGGMPPTKTLVGGISFNF